MFYLAIATLLAGGCASPPPPPQRARREPGPAAQPPRDNPYDTLDELFAADADPRRNEIVMIALSQLGTPYYWGGGRPETGFDCSGLVAYVFRQGAQLTLPRTAWDQARAARPIDVGDLRPADLVFFNTLGRQFSHVGLAIGEERFVHAPAARGVVRIESMQMDYWRARFNGARRVLT